MLMLAWVVVVAFAVGFVCAAIYQMGWGSFLACCGIFLAFLALVWALETTGMVS